jgi:hypothetical protein
MEGIMGPEGNLLTKMSQELQKACGPAAVNSNNESPPKKKASLVLS